MNIVEHLFKNADRRATALVSGSDAISFAQLIEMTDAAAAKIAPLRAERIGLDCPNGIRHVVLALAIVRAEKCLVPLAAELASVERERVIRETGVGAIVDADGAAREVALANDLAFDQAKLAALDPAFIRFSSGTTGTSKGVVLSHASLLARVTAANRGLRIGPEDRVKR